MDIKTIDVNTWLKNPNESELLQKVTENWNEIPLLVQNPQNLPINKLVRFKGMIQDMFDPEYYYASYEVTNKETKEKHVQPGKYTDTAFCSEQEFVNFQSKSNITKERQTFVVITAPGLNNWVLDLENNQHQGNAVTDMVISSNSTTKRSIEDDETEETMEVDNTQETTNKKTCVQRPETEAQNSTNVVSVDHLLNMPLPGRPGKAIHLKVYADSNKLKLNDLIEVVGFLSMDKIYQEGSEDSNDETMAETAMEMQTHHPPPSLIPRIHCVAIQPITDSSPLYQENMTQEELKAAKSELEIVLTQLLLGDKLAAEYLIYHLISKVYSRLELLALGKFTYNISNIPTGVLPTFGQQIYTVLEKLITKSHYLPMTLDNMNDLSFIPKKDYECNRITSGILQLSNNTHLVLDETKLSAGKLNAAGVQAVGAMANMIKNQRTNYDFNYYKMDFDCDICFLVMSEGKSLLPSDFHVVLKPEDSHITTFDEIIDALNVYLKPELLTSIRKYLANRRHAEYTISDDIHELVQSEFVKMRADHNSTAEDLHSLLVLARSVCLAEGKSVLDETCWKRACQLEQERKERLPH